MGIESTWWWPVATESELGEQPLAVTLLGEPLVLWRDAAGEPVALVDRCPHRGTPLSMGRVHEGAIACAYHGWRFAADGRCLQVPALPGFAPGPSQAAAVRAVRRAHGLLWVDPGGAHREPPALVGLAPRRLHFGPFEVQTSAPRAVENFLDTAHFAWVHQGWLGDPCEPQVPHHEVTETADGRPVVERYQAWQPRASASAQGGDWVDYRYEVLSPYSALLTKRGSSGGPEDSYVIWCCPSEPERTRVWFSQFTSDTGSSDEQLRQFQTTIFTQDAPVLEAQRPRRLPVSDSAPREAFTAADRLSLAYRAYLRATGVTFGTC